MDRKLRAWQIRNFWHSLETVLDDGKTDVSWATCLESVRQKIYPPVAISDGDSFDAFLQYLVAGFQRKESPFSSLHQALVAYCAGHGHVFVSPDQLEMVRCGEAVDVLSATCCRLANDWGDGPTQDICRFYWTLYGCMMSGVPIIPSVKLALKVFGSSMNEEKCHTCVGAIWSGFGLAGVFNVVPVLRGSSDVAIMAEAEQEGSKMDTLLSLTRESWNLSVPFLAR